jgi:hypothetical protein
MKVLGEFKCPKCGWVHVGISEADAVAAVNSFNEYFETLTPEEQQSFGGKNASIKHYQHCFLCRTPSIGFVPANPGDCPMGATMQTVIAPAPSRDAKETKYDIAVQT